MILDLLLTAALSRYFEKGDSDEEPDSKKGRVGGGEEEEEEEEEDDPLEAFMMGIEVLGQDQLGGLCSPTSSPCTHSVLNSKK